MKCFCMQCQKEKNDDDMVWHTPPGSKKRRICKSCKASLLLGRLKRSLKPSIVLNH